MPWTCFAPDERAGRRADRLGREGAVAADMLRVVPAGGAAVQAGIRPGRDPAATGEEPCGTDSVGVSASAVMRRTLRGVKPGGVRAIALNSRPIAAGSASRAAASSNGRRLASGWPRRQPVGALEQAEPGQEHPLRHRSVRRRPRRARPRRPGRRSRHAPSGRRRPVAPAGRPACRRARPAGCRPARSAPVRNPACSAAPPRAAIRRPDRVRERPRGLAHFAYVAHAVARFALAVAVPLRGSHSTTARPAHAAPPSPRRVRTNCRIGSASRNSLASRIIGPSGTTSRSVVPGRVRHRDALTPPATARTSRSGAPAAPRRNPARAARPPAARRPSACRAPAPPPPAAPGRGAQRPPGHRRPEPQHLAEHLADLRRRGEVGERVVAWRNRRRWPAP